MSEEMIARHCSPTLAGLKTGNMFSCHFASEEELIESIRSWNRILVSKGLSMLPLRYRNNRALIYLLRWSYLYRDLRCQTANSLLRERGYLSEKPEACISRLIGRLGESDEFPHEIGLFLGYPPEDVRGFIDKGAADCKCVGCWKVYGDADAAQKLFADYKRCTKDYCASLARGKSIASLAVAG